MLRHQKHIFININDLERLINIALFIILIDGKCVGDFAICEVN